MYKNSLRSELLIKEAVVSLLSEKKDLNKITVSEIVEKAGINRGTFYNHYKDIKDVLNQIEDEIMDSLIQKWKSSNKEEGMHFENFIRALTDTFLEKEDVCKKIIKNVPHHVFDDLKKKVSDVFANSASFRAMNKEERAFIVFISNGISGAYLDYFLERSEFTLREIEQYAVTLVRIVFHERMLFAQ